MCVTFSIENPNRSCIMALSIAIYIVCVRRCPLHWSYDMDVFINM